MKIRKLSTVFLSTAVCAAILTGCGERRETSLSDKPEESTASAAVSEFSVTEDTSDFSDTSPTTADVSTSSDASSAAATDDAKKPESSSADSTDADETSSVVSAPATASTTGQPASAPQSSPPQHEESSPPEHQHRYSLSASAEPTCLEIGYEVYSCSCGDRYTEVTSEALGHSYSRSQVLPDCTNGGYTTYTCTRCGQSYTDDKTDALGHKFTSKTVKATCTQNGYTLNTCSRCGDEYTSDSTAALGHDWSDWFVTQNATTTSEGKKTAECTRCGDVKTEAIAKLKADTNYAEEVVRLVNIEREKQGLSPLTVRADLTEYAQLRSTEIVADFDHSRPDGSSPLKYVMGLPNVLYAGENIAYGQSSPAAVVDAWMNSPGHRANILSAKFTSIGVGCYKNNGRLYWAQIFAG